jgi:hypothetical protein
VGFIIGNEQIGHINEENDESVSVGIINLNKSTE